MIRYQPKIVNKARELRGQSLSFQEIGRILSVPSNTIRNWCIDLGIDKHESLRINNELRRKAVRELDINFVPSISNITQEQARFFAALLYGCEGCKYPSTSLMAFVNSDPNLIKTFLKLLRKGFDLQENKFRVHLQLHDYHDSTHAIRFWSNLLSIPPEKFYKPTVTPPRGKMRRQNYQGTCSLRYADNKVQLRLLGIFERFCQGEVS